MKTLKSKKGQGTTEYILVIGIAVAIAVGILWKKLGATNGVLGQKMGDITTQIGRVNVTQ